MSADALAIGAVNTLYKKADGSVHATNTDWLALRDVLQSASCLASPAPWLYSVQVVLREQRVTRCSTLVWSLRSSRQGQAKAAALVKELDKATACSLASEIEPGTSLALHDSARGQRR